MIHILRIPVLSIFILFISCSNHNINDTEYFVIKIDDDKFKLATTSVNAFGGTAISISAVSGYSLIRIMNAPQLKINYKDSGGTVHNKNILLF